jgi:hypothetical protein
MLEYWMIGCPHACMPAAPFGGLARLAVLWRAVLFGGFTRRSFWRALFLEGPLAYPKPRYRRG